MKPIILLLLLTLNLHAQGIQNAQESWDTRYGPNRAAKAAAAKARPQILRVVDGKVYDAARSELWETMKGTFVALTTNGMILQSFQLYVVRMPNLPDTMRDPHLAGSYRPVETMHTLTTGPRVLVKNYLVKHPAGKELSFPAMRTGTATLQDGTVIAAYDIGTPYR